MKNIRVGSRVKYIKENDEARKNLGFFPPKGTLGTVIISEANYNSYVVRWDNGTKAPGEWFCRGDEIQPINEHHYENKRKHFGDGGRKRFSNRRKEAK